MKALISTALAALLLPAGAAACDKEGLAKVQHALSHASPSQLSTIAIAGLAEACPKPASLADAARKLAFAPPEHKVSLLARTLTQNMALWQRACAGGVATFEALAVVAPERRAPLLHQQCKASRFGFSVEDMAREGGAPMLALMYAQVLEESKAPAGPKAAIMAGLVGRR